jgi:hypothetical protein
LRWQEGNLGGHATVIAHCVVHLARAAAVTTTAASTVATTGLPAIGTALGLLITLASVKFLVISAECELRAALDAN